MPECQRKVSLASAFLSAFNFLSPALVFRHHGLVRYSCSWISPALPRYANHMWSIIILEILDWESHSRCSYLKKLTCKRTLRQEFICPRPPYPPRFLLGVVKQFCRFWIWSETERLTLAEYGLQHKLSTSPPPLPSHTLSVYTVLWLWFGRGGGGEPERRLEGQ